MKTLQNYNENEFYSQQKDIMIIMIIDFFKEKRLNSIITMHKTHFMRAYRTYIPILLKNVFHDYFFLTKPKFH
tara:strand:- start:20245 stop:20463 length:219 start_codon:yes stop_codon:yes gene_type:complete